MDDSRLFLVRLDRAVSPWVGSQDPRLADGAIKDELPLGRGWKEAIAASSGMTASAVEALRGVEGLEPPSLDPLGRRSSSEERCLPNANPGEAGLLRPSSRWSRDSLVDP
jgi:hypothetical protein